MKLPRLPVQVAQSSSWPEHTCLMGNVVMLDVGGKSPAWVREMAQTKEGLNILLRLLAAMAGRTGRKEQA